MVDIHARPVRPVRAVRAGGASPRRAAEAPRSSVAPKVVACAFAGLLVWQAWYHEGELGAAGLGGPPGLSRAAFGVARARPLEHTVWA